MGARFRPIAIAYVAVTLACVTIGCVCATFGQPATYGLTSAEALDVLDARPVGTMLVWVAYSVFVLLAALARAGGVTRRMPWVRWTALRGSIWLWGAIAAPWVYVLVAWDLQLYDLYPRAFGDQTETSFLSRVGGMWWFSGLLALAVGVVWSAAVAVRSARRPQVV